MIQRAYTYQGRLLIQPSPVNPRTPFASSAQHITRSPAQTSTSTHRLPALRSTKLASNAPPHCEEDPPCLHQSTRRPQAQNGWGPCPPATGLHHDDNAPPPRLCLHCCSMHRRDSVESMTSSSSGLPFQITIWFCPSVLELLVDFPCSLSWSSVVCSHHFSQTQVDGMTQQIHVVLVPLC